MNEKKNMQNYYEWERHVLLIKHPSKMMTLSALSAQLLWVHNIKHKKIGNGSQDGLPKTSVREGGPRLCVDYEWDSIWSIMCSSLSRWAGCTPVSQNNRNLQEILKLYYETIARILWVSVFCNQCSTHNYFACSFFLLWDSRTRRFRPPIRARDNSMWFHYHTMLSNDVRVKVQEGTSKRPPLHIWLALEQASCILAEM